MVGSGCWLGWGNSLILKMRSQAAASASELRRAEQIGNDRGLWSGRGRGGCHTDEQEESRSALNDRLVLL